MHAGTLHHTNAPAGRTASCCTCSLYMPTTCATASPNHLSARHATQEERDDALHILGVMSADWKEAAKGAPQAPGAEGVVIGNLQDSCQQFQYQLSAKLARQAAHAGMNRHQSAASSESTQASSRSGNW